MGCGASNNNVSDRGTTAGNRGTRANSNNSNNNIYGTTISSTNQQQSIRGGRGTTMISKHIMRPKNYRHGKQLTQRELNKQRSEFWATRTDGNVHMWGNIRSASEALVSNDLELANAILQAANIISTTGTMDVLYDERGHAYKVPVFCYANPIELMGENGGTSSNSGSSSSIVVAGGDSVITPVAMPLPSDYTIMDDNHETIVKGEPLKLKVRINPGDINLMIDADTTFSIYQLKHSILEQGLQSAVPIPEMSEHRQRIIFMGRELKNDNQKIVDIGFDEQKIVQVFLRPK